MGGKKGHTHLNGPQLKAAVCLSILNFLVDTRREVVNTFWAKLQACLSMCDLSVGTRH